MEQSKRDPGRQTGAIDGCHHEEETEAFWTPSEEKWDGESTDRRSKATTLKVAGAEVGRPRRLWKDDLKQCTGKGLAELKRIVEDRDRWRSNVQQ